MKKNKEKFLHTKAVKQEQKVTEQQESQVNSQEPRESEELEQLLDGLPEEQHEAIDTKEAEIQERADTTEDTGSEEVLDVIDWSVLKPTKSKASEKVGGEAGICTIVNSKQNGNKRIALAQKLLDEIDNPEVVQVGIMPIGIAIGAKIPTEASTFTVRKLGAKKVLYAGALVEEITQEFELDYSRRTCITFQKVKYDTVGGYKVALIIIQ